ncbi:MAG: hypothetical protein L6V93_08290 [Clostridiales bacterium]|nr:MAG: hypothetical protein L6V93_08290 [Clostridiales bacterium]
MDYGYLTYIDYEDGPRSPISGRILKSDGKFGQLEIKEKVKIDGKNYTSSKNRT